MWYQQLSSDLYLLRLEKGEEVLSLLKQFVHSHVPNGGVCSGLGAVEQLELAYFDIKAKEYRTLVFTESYEVTALAGTLAWNQDQVIAHLHGTFADQQMQPIAGHLNKAIVSGTLELWVQHSAIKLTRAADQESGLTLLTLEHRLG